MMRGMGTHGVRGIALLAVVPLLLLACQDTHDGGRFGGGIMSTGTAGTGWTTVTSGHAGSGGRGGARGTGGAAGGRGGAAGTQDGGTAQDGGHDMAGGPRCLGPGEVLCGGTCTPVTNPCTADQDCASDAAVPQVCNTDPCACSDHPRRCMPGCVTDADCGEGLTCRSSDHRCSIVYCASGQSACPANFTCDTFFLAPECVRTMCTTDSQCSGACVGGQCYPSPGHCGFPPA